MSNKIERNSLGWRIKIQPSDRSNKNNLAVILFIIVSFLLLFVWKYFDLPNNTAVDFVVRSITITVLSILTTWLVLKFVK